MPALVIIVLLIALCFVWLDVKMGGSVMEFPMKEVYFDEYCPKCEFLENKETEKPCCECLCYPTNEHSHKPVKFKEKISNKN